jgi:GNAT superfamily N-acetyltransferase
MRRSIQLLLPRTENEWRNAGMLIAELVEWDLRQSESLGFSPDEVRSIFYASESDIRRDSVPPLGCLLLAVDGGMPLGCAAYRRLNSETCELYDVYVRPESRGRGIGSMLLRRLMVGAKNAGYCAMCLETASFMHDAHKLYGSLRFRERAPYRTLPTKFAKVTLWMEAHLAESRAGRSGQI